MSSRRVLVSLKSYLGDAVMASPMIAALERSCEVTIESSAPVAEVLWTPDGRRFQLSCRERGIVPVLRHAQQLRRGQFDVALAVNRSFRTALMLRLAGIPRRIGFSHEGRRFLLTDPISGPKDEFEADALMRLLVPLGVPASAAIPYLHVADEESTGGDTRRGAATVALQPGARYPEKQIPLETLVTVANRLTEAGQSIALVGGPEERLAADQFRQRCSIVPVDLVGRTHLREILAVLRGCRLVVGGDTGVMHLAAGVGAPTLTVFGPTLPERWGHNYPPHRVLQAPRRRISTVTPEELSRCALDMLS